MTQALRIAYLDRDHLARDSEAAPVSLVLEAEMPGQDFGYNGLILRSGQVRVTGAAQGGKTMALPDGLLFEDRLLSPGQRRARADLRAQIAALPGLGGPGAGTALVFALPANGRLRTYHRVEETEREMLALCLGEVEDPGESADPLGWFEAALRPLRPVIAAKRALLSSRRAYLQWRPEMELERKFTFDRLPDTWALHSALFEALYQGRWPGYFPEPHMGIQVFDYENHPYEVSAPPTEHGYISFIPQVDGRVTVKRKWFRANAELRRETLWPGQEIDPDSFDAEARARVAGVLRPLPPFRRKRLDVNFESLATGHVFGVYFDICTQVGGPARFGQVEVEYCRSRCLGPLAGVEAEFETLATAIAGFLRDHGVAFRRDLYSKLDFARDALAQQVAS
jgi:hypothetical protein